MVRFEHLLVDVSPEFLEDARRFYAVRPAGRGPRTAEELRAARSARNAPAPSDPPADEDVVRVGGVAAWWREDGRVSARLLHVAPRAARVAVRLSFEEEDRIRQAAQGAGLSVSAFLRQAGLSAARADVVNLERLRCDLNEARARIDDACQALK